MMIINQLAIQHLGRSFFPSPAFERSILAYTFGQADSVKLAQQIRRTFKVDHATAVNFRMGLQANGYLQQCVKPWLFRLSKYGIRNPAEVEALAATYEVLPDDVPLVEHLDHPSLASLAELHRFTALSAAKYRRHYASMYRALEPTARRMVWRKHRFIFKQPANGVEAQDLIHDVLAKGLQGFAVQYPRMDCLLHAVNIGKRSLSNQGINVINYHTAQSRANLTAQGEGFQSTVFFVEDDDRRMGAHDPHMLAFEGNHSLQRLLEHYHGRKRGAIMSLMGLPNVSFTRWLLTNAQQRHRMSNDDLLDLLIERGQHHQYEEYLCRWLSIRPQQLTALKTQLQEVL